MQRHVDPKPPAHRIALPVLGVLVAVLGIQLVREKNHVAQLRSGLFATTRAFVAGTTVPSIPLTQLGGRATTLDSLCWDNSGIVAIFVRESCTLCSELQSDWRELASRMATGRVVLVELDPGREAGPSQEPEGGRVIETFAGAYGPPGTLHPTSVPAVMVSDEACRIQAVSGGLTSTRLLLRTVAREEDR